MKTQTEILGDLGRIIGSYSSATRKVAGLHSWLKYRRKEEPEIFLPDSLVSGVKSLYGIIPADAGSISKLNRPDLAHSMWADVHRLSRNTAKNLLNPVLAAAHQHPDNQELAAIAAVASDRYKTFKSHYMAAQKVEARYKQEFRKNHQGEESANKAAKQAWANSHAAELHQDKTMQEVRKNTEDARAYYPLPPNKEKTATDYKDLLNRSRIEQYATLVADYKECFPDLDDDTLLSAIEMGEKLAAYSFIAQFGLKELNDSNLGKALEWSAELALPGAMEIATLSDKLIASPYNVKMGIDEAQLGKQLAGHSRQMQVYSVVEQLFLGKTTLADTLPILEEYGIKEDSEICTGLEMGAILGAIGYEIDDTSIIALSNAFSTAQSKDELNNLLQSPEYTTMLETLNALDISEILSEKQDALEKVKARTLPALKEFRIDKGQEANAWKGVATLLDSIGYQLRDVSLLQLSDKLPKTDGKLSAELKPKYEAAVEALENLDPSKVALTTKHAFNKAIALMEKTKELEIKVPHSAAKALSARSESSLSR